MWFCAKGSQKISNHYEAQLYLLSSDEGGRHKPLQVILSKIIYSLRDISTLKTSEFQISGYCTPMYSMTWNIIARLDLLLPAGTDMLMPGEHGTTRVTLLDAMPMLVGQAFTMRENRRTVATGIITKVLDSISVNKRKMNEVVIPDLVRVKG